MLKFIFVILQFAGTASLAQNQLGLNDISVLAPLPQQNEFDHMLKPADGASRGPLLNQTVIGILPILVTQIGPDQLYSQNLKVIGIRFDPCFREGFALAACQPQIRLIWQPVVWQNNKPSTLDAAVHTFYHLTAQGWARVTTELEKISGTDTGAPLQIHPTLTTEGYAGPYWKKLKNLVLGFAGQNNLMRVTTMTVRMDRVWGFRGFDRAGETWTQMDLPTLKIPAKPSTKIINQAFFLDPNGLLNLKEFRGGITMIETSHAGWFRLFSDSVKFRETQTEEEIRLALARAYQLENPDRHNPATADCVSCHVAQTVRLWGSEHFKSLAFQSDAYRNLKYDLTNTSVDPWMTNKTRAFGYFNDKPAISQRVINETAAILSP